MDSDGVKDDRPIPVQRWLAVQMEADELQVVSEGLEISNNVELTQRIPCKVRQPSYQLVDHISRLHS
jgi:hypothetical protein